MSRRGVICVEKNGRCELCGRIEELRPYGPNCENVCFECGMKDEKAATKRLMQHIFGERLDS